jgi:hypothetical protein
VPGHLRAQQGAKRDEPATCRNGHSLFFGQGREDTALDHWGRQRAVAAYLCGDGCVNGAAHSGRVDVLPEAERVNEAANE